MVSEIDYYIYILTQIGNFVLEWLPLIGMIVVAFILVFKARKKYLVAQKPAKLQEEFGLDINPEVPTDLPSGCAEERITLVAKLHKQTFVAVVGERVIHLKNAVADRDGVVIWNDQRKTLPNFTASAVEPHILFIEPRKLAIGWLSKRLLPRKMFLEVHFVDDKHLATTYDPLTGKIAADALLQANVTNPLFEKHQDKQLRAAQLTFAKFLKSGTMKQAFVDMRKAIKATMFDVLIPLALIVALVLIVAMSYFGG